MDEEESGQALLPVQRLEDPVAIDLPVDEVQSDRRATGCRGEEDVEKVLTDGVYAL